MTNPMLAELDEVVRLMDAATPGPWTCGLDGHGGMSLETDDCDGVQITMFRELKRHANGNYIAALHNFLRTHHATLADMAKRLEAAERDAERYRDAIQHHKDEYGDELLGGDAELWAVLDTATQEGEG